MYYRENGKIIEEFKFLDGSDSYKKPLWFTILTILLLLILFSIPIYALIKKN
jgi:hypothetical protein